MPLHMMRCTSRNTRFSSRGLGVAPRAIFLATATVTSFHRHQFSSPPPPVSSPPATAAVRFPLLKPFATSREPLPPLVEKLLQTPGLEAPEGSSPEQMLRVTEAFWKAMKDPTTASKPTGTALVITEDLQNDLPNSPNPEFDVCIAGGTLGIFLALSLQQSGHRVVVVERRSLQGRVQEWNTSRAEVEKLVDMGLLTQEELDECIVTAWEYDRIGFKGGEHDIFISDVLNIGVSPRRLIDAFKRRFLEAGGVVLEHTAFKSAVVYRNGAEVKLLPGAGGLPLTAADVNRPTAVANTAYDDGSSSSNGNNGSNGNSLPRKMVTTRVLIDCMGHYSPIVKQIRHGQQPDGVVVVVGGSFTHKSDQQQPSSSLNTTTTLNNNNSPFPEFADLLYSFTDSFDDSQMFWEAFPADGGASRTAYMFLYTDIHPERATFTSLLNTYLELLPQYQLQRTGTAAAAGTLDDITFKRILFGGFPCYMHKSPLPPAFSRVLQVGDAAATQSPLSFGGFGAMLRHLPRLTRGLDEALHQDRLQRRDLGWLQPYQPALSAAWLFQRSMSVKTGQLKNSREANVTKKEIEEEVDSEVKNSRRKGGWMPVDHVNRLLRCNFAVMKVLGDRILRPFVQDAIQAGPLALTMWGMMLKAPITITAVLFQVGPWMILKWFAHFFALLSAAVLFLVLRPLRSKISNFSFQRFLDALEYGSASDYEYRAGKCVYVRAGEEMKKEIKEEIKEEVVVENWPPVVAAT